jgi:hypothetical protein
MPYLAVHLRRATVMKRDTTSNSYEVANSVCPGILVLDDIYIASLDAIWHISEILHALGAWEEVFGGFAVGQVPYETDVKLWPCL